MRFSQLEGLRVGVWGAAREIRSLAAQLSKRAPAATIAVAVFDGEPPAGVAEALRSPGVRVAGAADALDALSGCDVLVRSPGVSTHRPELRALSAAGVPVTTATSLWLAEREGQRVIGVTGTKGKSTTAALLHRLARAAGLRAELAGNIGVPALDLLDRPDFDVAVVELSSYQIADLAAGPEVALFTNLFREHADWHGSEQAYRAEKLRLLTLPGVRAAVLNGRDEGLMEAVGDAPEIALTLYGVPGGWQPTADAIELRGERVLERSRLPLPGEHNALNLCGALAALEAFGTRPPPLAQALSGFEALPHRLQTVVRSRGVQWVDDSISTTPESTLAALESFAGPRGRADRRRAGPRAGLRGARARARRAQHRRDRRAQHRPADRRGGATRGRGARARRARTRPRRGRGARARARELRRGDPSLARRAQLRQLPRLRGARRALQGARVSGVAQPRRTPKAGGAPLRGAPPVECCWVSAVYYGHSGFVGTPSHGSGIVGCGPGAGCASTVRDSEIACSSSR